MLVLVDRLSYSVFANVTICSPQLQIYKEQTKFSNNQNVEKNCVIGTRTVLYYCRRAPVALFFAHVEKKTNQPSPKEIYLL